MKGIVNWYNGKKGYGFIYGTGCDAENINDVLPEYFVHSSQIKGKKPKEFSMVEFQPDKNEKGNVALNVKVIEYDTTYDPRGYISERILDEFDMRIPCLSWMDFLFEDMKEIYNYLRAKSDNNVDELKRLTEKYDLNKIPEEEITLCIAQGSYESYVQWKREEEELFANDLLGIL